jgi:hypothetical protein
MAEARKQEPPPPVAPPAIRYKPGRLLDPTEDERLLDKMTLAGSKNLTADETAVMLGVSASTLSKFWGEFPDYKEAWLYGKGLRRIKLRGMGDMHAMMDAPTWRFLAKNELALSDDPSKAKADEASAKLIKAMTPEEARGRILELQAKLVGERIVPRETYTTQGQPDGQQVLAGSRSGRLEEGAARARSAGGARVGRAAVSAPAASFDGGAPYQALDSAPGSTPPLDAGSVVADPAFGKGWLAKAQPVDDRPAIQARVQEVHARAAEGDAAQPRRARQGSAGAQPTAIEKAEAVIAKLQERLGALEASAVRKAPRKDGQPHTDRTKPAPAEPTPAQPAQRPAHWPPLLKR